jgi:hypothetical protein
MKRLRGRRVEVVSVVSMAKLGVVEVAMDPNAANPVALADYRVKVNLGRGQGGLTVAGEKMAKSQVLLSGGKVRRKLRGARSQLLMPL